MELVDCKLCGGKAIKVGTVEPIVYCNDEDCRLNHGDGFSVDEWQELNDDTPRVDALCKENHRLRVIMGEAADFTCMTPKKVENCEPTCVGMDCDYGDCYNCWHSKGACPQGVMAVKLKEAANEGCEVNDES